MGAYIVTFGFENYAPSGQVLVLGARNRSDAEARGIMVAVRDLLREGIARLRAGEASRAEWKRKGMYTASCDDHKPTDEISTCGKCGYDTWGLRNQSQDVACLYVESIKAFHDLEYLNWSYPE